MDFENIVNSDENIKVINLEDLVNFHLQNKEYNISENDMHPNKKAWEKIVPALIKKLKI